jgi:predicted 3-demethylubiquinone-9 3-methyltransferase (glyoxalase superfamily)
MNKIVNCLWYDSNAEEAVNFYVSVFPNSGVDKISYYAKEGQEFHRKPEGSVMMMEFNLNGQQFLAMNAGPAFKFNESISLMINCKDQAEIDQYWYGLIADGGNESMCGWLKDRFGLSWQVVYEGWGKMVTDPDKEKVGRLLQALYKMRKPDLDVLQKAFNGE